MIFNLFECEISALILTVSVCKCAQNMEIHRFYCFVVRTRAAVISVIEK